MVLGLCPLVSVFSSAAVILSWSFFVSIPFYNAYMMLWTEINYLYNQTTGDIFYGCFFFFFQIAVFILRSLLGEGMGCKMVSGVPAGCKAGSVTCFVGVSGWVHLNGGYRGSCRSSCILRFLWRAHLLKHLASQRLAYLTSFRRMTSAWPTPIQNKILNC